MIEVRPDQLQIFRDKVRATYVKRVCTYLLEKRGEWVSKLQKDDLDALVRRQVLVAESFGIASETGVVRFIEVALILGEDFVSSGKYPEAERILLQANMDAELKMQSLEEIAAQTELKGAGVSGR